jgi:Tol biopolymer transport system component
VDAKTEEATEWIALLNLETMAPPRMLAVDGRISGGVEFTPDGKAITYVARDKGVDNVWVQPLDASAPRQITNFTYDQVDIVHWSPDGKRLAILRAHSESDVVLLQEAKP